MLNRRDVLRLGLLAPAASALSVGLAEEASASRPQGSPGIKRYRTLGRTGERVSDLGYGGGPPQGDPALIVRALELGITYFDTAPDYGDSERSIGEGWRKAGVARDRFHITTKMCAPRPYPGCAPRGTSAKQLVEWVEGSLKRLRTDHVDNVLLHAVGERDPNDLERLRDPEMLEAFSRLKQQGKARFLGCSSHGPHKPLESFTYAIESGQFDIIMPAYNLFTWPWLDRVIKLAHSKGVGVMVMKTLQGGEKARAKGLLPAGDFAQACFKWVWSNPAVAGLVVTIKSRAQLDGYAAASGGTLAHREAGQLGRLAAATSAEVCRIGCGDCLGSCPQGVEIPTVLRQDLYHTQYGEPDRARAGYTELTQRGGSALACLTCTDQRCLDACTTGLPIRPSLLAAHERLEE